MSDNIAKMSVGSIAKMSASITKMNKEFDAADAFAKALRRHNMTPVVDDDYPEVRHDYESALAALLRAMEGNGRFAAGNRYGLQKVK